MSGKITAKQIFNPIFFINLLALSVISAQFFFGFFVDPKIQIGILAFINILFRALTGVAPYTGEISAPVNEPVVVPKLWYESKMLWVSILGFVGGVIQSITGWAIPAESYVEILAGVSFVISIITHKPVRIS